VWYRRARHLEVADHVGAQRFVEALVGDVLDRGGMQLERRIVGQHVETAEGVDRLLDRRAAECARLDVAFYQDAAATFLFDMLARDLGVLRFTEIDHGDVGAFAREQHGDRAADSRVGAGDPVRLSCPSCPVCPAAPAGVGACRCWHVRCRHEASVSSECLAREREPTS